MKWVEVPGTLVRHELLLQGRCQRCGGAGKPLKTQGKAAGRAGARCNVPAGARQNSCVRTVSATAEMQVRPIQTRQKRRLRSGAPFGTRRFAGLHRVAAL
jgi:hypothetical protein